MPTPLPPSATAQRTLTRRPLLAWCTLLACCAPLASCAGNPALERPDLTVGLDEETTSWRAITHLKGYGYAITERHEDGVSMVVPGGTSSIQPQGTRLYFAQRSSSEPRTAVRVDGGIAAPLEPDREPDNGAFDGSRNTLELLRAHFAAELVED